MSVKCAKCRAELPDGARFCGACGAATSAHKRSVEARDRYDQRRHTRNVVALAIVFVAPLVGLLLSSEWYDGESDFGEWAEVAIDVLSMASIAAIAAVVSGSLVETVPLRCRWPWLVMAPAVALGTIAVAIAYVRVLGGDDDDEPVSAATWVSVVVVAPLLEEWLCRGVAWRASAAVAGPRTTLWITSVMFAFLHGLAGHLLAVPHRLLGGIGFGWLRWQSGSLLPGVLAHAAHNALAIGLLGG